jgi:hypothetical protein
MSDTTHDPAFGSTEIANQPTEREGLEAGIGDDLAALERLISPCKRFIETPDVLIIDTVNLWRERAGALAPEQLRELAVHLRRARELLGE